MSASTLPAQTEATEPAPGSTIENGIMKLEEVRVLGTHLRMVDAEGPSPVEVYNRDYIDASGAMTLADFLNTLPQNYAGISAGRGSAPNELNPEFGQRTETTSPAFNFVLGAADAPPGQTGQSGVSLRGLGSGSTLVLVNGRRVAQSSIGNSSTNSHQGFVDLNTIPLGMIDHIEITTDGSSAIYGADAVAGVINIVLKKNWSGREVSLAYKGAFDGGGVERNAIFSAGFAKGKLRGTVSGEYYDRADLKASQRDFTANQDHTAIIAGYNADGTPVYGRDFRLNYGYPATVQARSGTLNGMFRPDGTTPTNIALTPEGYAETPPLSAFIGRGPVPPNTGVFATGQRRGNTAEFIDLIPESERKSVSTSLNYQVNNRLEIYGRYTYSDTKGVYSTQPPLSTAASSSGFGNFATIVPAAYNPFGQDVLVGMVHYEFGSIKQWTETKAHFGEFGANGTIGKTWEWDAAMTIQKQSFDRLTRNFNGAAITAALANPDAALRLNPFLDARTGSPSQAAIYESMALYTTLAGTANYHTFDLNADGSVWELPGGPIQLAVGGTYESAKNSSTAATPTVAVNPVINTTTAGGDRDTFGLYAEVGIPIFGKENAVPLAKRLDLQIAGRYEDQDDAGHTTIPKYGITWSPTKSVLFRASYSEGFRAPALTEYQVAGSSFNSTLTDPLRDPPSTSGVATTRGSNPDIKPETSTSEFYGVVFEPGFAPGLSFKVNYYRTKQDNVIQVLSAQTIVNNESIFPDRVVRAAPDASDIALNQPGRILSVDTTLINFGFVLNESVDYVLDYTLPSKRLGTWRVSATASQTLKSERAVAPGVPAIDDDGDTFAPPKWRGSAAIYWNSGPWTGSLFATYLDGFSTNKAGNTFTSTYPIPSQFKLDVRGTYTFKKGVWRGYGRDMRIGIGIGNVLDEDPPFSDTVFGFNGALHSPMGRTYELSLTQPF